MPIVKVNSGLIRSYITGQDAPEPILERGRPFVATGSVANAATDSQGSTYKLVELPSECVLRPDTAFHVANWGYADIRIGTLSDPVVLASVLKSAGNTVSPIVAGDTAKHGKYLWQVLGLAADPGGLIGLYAHGSVANAVAAGSMLFTISYLFR